MSYTYNTIPYAVTQVKQDMLDAYYGISGASPPATFYFGLLTALPDNQGAGSVEVTGGSYARVAMTNNATNFPATVTGTPVLSGQKTIATTITFPAATANWGSVVGLSMYLASSGGVPIIWIPMTSTAVNSGHTASINAGDFNLWSAYFA